MIDVHGIGAFGIVPFLSEDILKQTRLANIKSRAGKIAYLLTLGEKSPTPHVKEGVHEARGALKWIAEVLGDSKEREEK